MNLLNTLLIYLTMVFVSSVQMAPEPSPVPVTPTPSPTAIVTVAPSATATPTAVPTPAITPNNDYPTLEVGDKGDDVTLMQRRLAELGYYAGDIDGVFGNQTRRAVERFQYYQGLTVDGIAGKKTLTVLYESSDVVFAPVDVPTPTPTASPTAKPTAAVTTPPATQTPAPTFVPTATPSPTPSPTPTPTATPTATATVAPRASVATAAAAETASAGPSVSPEATATPESTGTAAEITGIPAVTDAADTTEPAETPVAAPAPTVNDTQVFVLAGSEEPMTLFGDTEPSGAEADVLHPAQLAETVYVPLLEILKNAGVEIVPESYDQQRIVSFTLADGVYTLSYTQQDESAVTDVTVTVNDEAWALTLDTGFVLEGVLYLPLDTATEATGATFMLDEATGVYTVALPETAAETTPAAQAITTPTLDATRTFLLEGSDQPLTVDPADAQSETLRPLLYGDTVYAPVLPILKNLGSIVLPNAVEGSREAAFSLGSDLFQLSCTVDETGAISGLTVLKNQEPQIIADRTGWEADGILYLPLASVTEATGVTFTPNEDGTAYVAALPAGAVIAE